MEKRYSPIKAMIQTAITELRPAEVNPAEITSLTMYDAISQSVSKEAQANLINALKYSLPADHPWFRVMGITPPILKGGMALPKSRTNISPILSPALSNWRLDIPQTEMDAAKNATVGYEAKDAHVRRAKAEAMRRDTSKLPFHRIGEAPVQDHQWFAKQLLALQ